MEDIVAFFVGLALVPVMALMFMWGYSLAAPSLSWPPLDYTASFGLMLALRIVLPPYTVRVGSR